MEDTTSEFEVQTRIMKVTLQKQNNRNIMSGPDPNMSERNKTGYFYAVQEVGYPAHSRLILIKWT